MKTFQEFLEYISEGKKVQEIRKAVQKNVKKQQKQNPDQPAVRDYDVMHSDSEPGSKQRQRQIDAMMADMKKARKQHWGT